MAVGPRVDLQSRPYDHDRGVTTVLWRMIAAAATSLWRGGSGPLRCTYGRREARGVGDSHWRTIAIMTVCTVWSAAHRIEHHENLLNLIPTAIISLTSQSPQSKQRIYSTAKN